MFLPPNSASISHRFLCFSCFSIFRCDLMPFNFLQTLATGRSLALAPKKSVALQARQGLSATAPSAGQAPPVVVPVPSAGQADAGAEGAPSEVAEQPTSEAILLPMSEQAELPHALMTPSVVGVAPPVEAPPT